MSEIKKFNCFYPAAGQERSMGLSGRTFKGSLVVRR